MKEPENEDGSVEGQDHLTYLEIDKHWEDYLNWCREQENSSSPHD
tara:strand:+ start:17228 stop:17362 length:135 start_codon:yes stop_codon:yes gene_type:complete